MKVNPSVIMMMKVIPALLLLVTLDQSDLTEEQESLALACIF